MIQLIKDIDNAWNNNDILFNVNPKACNGYFDFRNRVVLKYNRKHIEGRVY